MFGIVSNITKKLNPQLGSTGDSLNVSDYWLTHALKVIESDYGDTVSVDRKNKDLLKFGRNLLVGTDAATLQIQPAGILHETYVSSNLINSIISTSALDTEEVVIEGHTSSDGITFVFVSQTLSLTGQTVAPLGTPLARVTRVYNNSATTLVGTISVTETDTYTAGVPDTNTKVHIQISPGEQQSEKAATTISSTDYWIVTGYYGDYLKKLAGFAEVGLQLRLPGKVFRQLIHITCNEGARGYHPFKPYFIVPKNSDIRLVSTASATGSEISGGIQGVLAKVV